MPMSPADARFHFDRALGLFRRGMASLRTRGLRATWQRVAMILQVRAPAAGRTLFQPDEALAPAFAECAAPAASIVVPVHNQLPHTLLCLQALSQRAARAPFEVIVVDDGSSDGTEATLGTVPGLRYLRRPVNGGFIAACNDGAAAARGDVLVFLNNDTIPQPGWLDALLDTFDGHPDAGIVGAKLLYPDGRLQEAGAIVLDDGSAESRGRFDDPARPAYGFVAEVDYVSGAALAIRAALFREIGGFDSLYAPAYYEDTDLAFAARARGRRVLYQPASTVVHLEGATAGTDIASGTKANQARNRGRFAKKWSGVLPGQPRAGSVPDAAPPRAHRHQVLVIDALTPSPDRDSGSLRLVNLMRLLGEDGAHVVFLPANRAHAGEDTLRLQRMGVEAWHAPYARRAPAWLAEHGHRFDTVLVCRHYVAREFLPLLRRHAPQARIVFDTVDLHYLRERRGAELAGDPALLRAAERTRALELDIIARADTTLVVSETERELLSRDAPGARVEVLSNLHQLAGPGLPFAQRHDLVFVGGFRHPPNVDAVRWFVDEVFPRVRARLPDVRFHCIGGHVPPAIGELASRGGVLVHGHLPDIDGYMDGARVALAPLRYGAGVKGKVNLSMAHGQPVVATPCAVEGMHLRDGVDVLVAGDADGFAEAVVRAYTDEALWSQLAANGRDNVARHFSLDAGREVVRRVLLAG